MTVPHCIEYEYTSASCSPQGKSGHFVTFYEALNSSSGHHSTRQTGRQWKTTGMLSEMYVQSLSSVVKAYEMSRLFLTLHVLYMRLGMSKNTSYKRISVHVEAIIKKI